MIPHPYGQGITNPFNEQVTVTYAIHFSCKYFPATKYSFVLRINANGGKTCHSPEKFTPVSIPKLGKIKIMDF